MKIIKTPSINIEILIVLGGIVTYLGAIFTTILPLSGSIADYNLQQEQRSAFAMAKSIWDKPHKGFLLPKIQQYGRFIPIIH